MSNCDPSCYIEKPSKIVVVETKNKRKININGSIREKICRCVEKIRVPFTHTQHQQKKTNRLVCAINIS